jgi:hypothetical protein
MSDRPHPSIPPREVIAPRRESLRKSFDRISGPSPLEYGEVRLWLVARDRRSLFAYWELAPEEHPEATAGDGAPHFFLRIVREDGHVEATTEIQPAAGDWTIMVSKSDASYTAELGFFCKDHVWCFLARSGSTRTPSADGQVITERSLVAMRALLGEDPPPEGSPKDLPWNSALEARLQKLLAADVAKMAEGNRPSDHGTPLPSNHRN